MNRSDLAESFRQIFRSPGTEDECVAEAVAVCEEFGAALVERYARKPLPQHLTVGTANLSDEKAAGL